MRTQISLVGKEVFPLYVGIIEFNPDEIHFVASNESREGIILLKPFLENRIFFEHICKAHDLFSILSVCEPIILKMKENDEISFNLTGGTKVMLLAAQALIQKYNSIGFYLNPDSTILKIPTYTLEKLKCEIS